MLRRKLFSRVIGFSGWLLGLFGVSCMQHDPTAYGCPLYDFKLTVQGKVLSAADSSAVQGIVVGLYHQESQHFFLTESDQEGNYSVTLDTPYPDLLPDSHLVSAMDQDGLQNGAFQDMELWIYAPYIGGETVIGQDFYLEPEESL